MKRSGVPGFALLLVYGFPGFVFPGFVFFWFCIAWFCFFSGFVFPGLVFSWFGLLMVFMVFLRVPKSLFFLRFLRTSGDVFEIMWGLAKKHFGEYVFIFRF